MGALDTSTVEEELGAIVKSVFDRVIVEVLVDQILTLPIFTIVSSA